MGELDDYSLDQVAGALALTLGSLGGLCLILFKSRCETISICWGAWKCSRKVSEDDAGDDVAKQEPVVEQVTEPVIPPVNPPVVNP